MRTKIASNTTAIHTEIDHVKANVRAVEEGMSTWSDEVVSVQTTTTDLMKQVKKLKEKCEDMEGRMRRGNIRIMVVAEQPGSGSPTAVSKLLKEGLRMDTSGKCFEGDKVSVMEYSSLPDSASPTTTRRRSSWMLPKPWPTLRLKSFQQLRRTSPNYT